MATITTTTAVDLLNLSNDNFWYMGLLSRDAFGSSWVTGDTSFNTSRGGKVLRFEGSFTTSSTSDPVTSVSFLNSLGTKTLTLTFKSGTTEEDAQHSSPQGNFT